MGAVNLGGVVAGISSRKIYRQSFRVLIVSLALAILVSGPARAEQREFKTYDMMGFSYVPPQHQGKNLQKIPVCWKLQIQYGLLRIN